MRDPKRIDRILEKIRIVWHKSPELRLCQLIGNCFPVCDNYYREDDVLEERLDRIYKEVSK